MSIFDRLSIGQIRSRAKSSVRWFSNLIRGRGKELSPGEYVSLDKLRPGHMYSYVYDPKHKNTLPYYDKFPLIIMVDYAKGGFYGLNLHYLPPRLRERLFNELLKTSTNKKMTEDSKLKINYSILLKISKSGLYAPCFKHYLFNHVQGRVLRVNPEQWEEAIFMPTEQFEKASARSVWADSKKRV